MCAAHIVIVEDNPADVHLVKLALREQQIQYSLTRFENGMEALKAFRSNHVTLKPDVILLDLNTPGADGFEVLGELLRLPELSGVPIAILTSSTAAEDKRRAAVAGVRYIEKKMQLQDFLSTVGGTVKQMLAASVRL